MKGHILFSGKDKKNISKCRLLKILPRVLSVNYIFYICTFECVIVSYIILWISFPDTPIR